MTLKIPKIELTKQNAIIFTAKLPLMKQHQKELWQSLSGQEKIQAEGFVNNTLKDKYILSHGLLRYLLSLYVERNPQDIQYLVNQFGKPFLKDDNCTLQFNMSHSKDYAVYIIALEDQVGIDIEWKDKDINIQEIFELVLSPTEVTNFNQLNSEEKFHAFYCIWTKKEAIIKAIGQGLSYPIKTIEVMNSIHDNKSYCIANGNAFYFLNLHNLDNYAGAVALTYQLNQLIQVDLATYEIKSIICLPPTKP
jgi:phosphopantetheine--protein transferase-like protein